MNDRVFRNAMGTFATGVTVVTTEDISIHGMTANAFVSVSLDPKLVLISVGNNAKMYEKITKSKKYAINILSKEQENISKLFAGQKRDDDIDVPFSNLKGIPIIEGSLVNISCEVIDSIVQGDHTLFVGQVTGIKEEDEEKEPLIFYKGDYRELTTKETNKTLQ